MIGLEDLEWIVKSKDKVIKELFKKIENYGQKIEKLTEEWNLRVQITKSSMKARHSLLSERFRLKRSRMSEFLLDRTESERRLEKELRERREVLNKEEGCKNEGRHYRWVIRGNEHRRIKQMSTITADN
ncbi:hypothetical protein BpHYR1_019299 [Brachionus plicatilis]|uniref:Uncharacterized protein n=1 Tax=Brachionus plicatilis TaxID=10195 RepID=A0A3M7RHH4_BRAPC|nr:hypothetical protein BpHYR1_019299 [Brachionus plicatilis]